MGHHFVPQFYLRGFESLFDEGKVWLHPKHPGKAPRLAPIEEVAQAKGFYEPETERTLAEEIERPANPLLHRLRTGQGIEDSKRPVLALYLATMTKRVPRNRLRAENLVQPALKSTVDNLRNALKELHSEGRISTELLERRLREADDAHAKFAKDAPNRVKDQIRDPLPTQPIVDAILAMSWRILVAEPPEQFITSDNPAFFHSAYGVGSPESELRFPLSPRLALHGSMVPNPLGYLSAHRAPREWIREFNRSTAAEATSIAFSHKNVAWVQTLLRRQNPYLFRLVWQLPQN